VSFERLPFATIDHLRPITQGHQEVIFCPGKTVGQVVAIAERLEVASGTFLATRADAAQGVGLRTRFPRAEVNELGRTVYLPSDPEPPPTGRGTVLICTAGTSDLAVAEEAAVSARALKNAVERVTDVGVAGIHRLLSQTDVLRAAGVIIVVAGMEGALPSVVGGRPDECGLRGIVRGTRGPARHAQFLRVGRHGRQHRQRIRRRRGRQPHQSFLSAPRGEGGRGAGSRSRCKLEVSPESLSAPGAASLGR
jgi:hypothetical protein